MGLFDGLKKLSQGNFGLISRNWGYIYLRLFQLHRDKFASPEAIMIAASVINANPYLMKNQITLRDLSMSLEFAERGACGITPSMPNTSLRDRPMVHGVLGNFSPQGEADYELMLNYCVQYVALLLAVDSPRMESQEVLRATVLAKPKIHESLEALFRQLQYGKGQKYPTNILVESVMEMRSEQPMTNLMSSLMKKNPRLSSIPEEPKYCSICHSQDNVLLYYANGKEHLLCQRHQSSRSKMKKPVFDRHLALMDEAAGEYSPDGDIKQFTRLVMKIIKNPEFADFWCNWIDSDRYVDIVKEIKTEDTRCSICGSADGAIIYCANNQEYFVCRKHLDVRNETEGIFNRFDYFLKLMDEADEILLGNQDMHRLTNIIEIVSKDPELSELWNDKTNADKESNKGALGIEKNRRQLRVVIGNIDPPLSKLIKALLESILPEGVELIMESTFFGEDLLCLAEQEKADLFVFVFNNIGFKNSDIQLPNSKVRIQGTASSGTDQKLQSTLRLISHIKETFNAPIVVFSGCDGKNPPLTKHIKDIADIFLPLPFDIKSFKQQIIELLPAGILAD